MTAPSRPTASSSSSSSSSTAPSRSTASSSSSSSSSSNANQTAPPGPDAGASSASRSSAGASPGSRSVDVTPGPPLDEDELLARARALSGVPLGELARGQGRETPESLARAKGFVGQTLERALGATAGGRDVPDFPALGIELKTLPIGRDGAPRESTFVATCELASMPPWPASRVRRKLARVLWVPVEASRDVDVADRRIGLALLWSPDDDDDARLARDYEGVRDLARRGLIDALTARFGEVLQVRPKAARASVRQELVDDDGERYATLPRGFYLRRSFTTELLRRHYHRGAPR